ncbi:TPA: hypothetical protein N5L31_003927 [Enterobacter bugandensis]|nr:hypothetical protein [Enterobacter bugandensis]
MMNQLNVKLITLMTENKPYKFGVIGLLFIIPALLYFYEDDRKIEWPFKCYGFTEYALLDNKDIVTFDLSQDFRIFSKDVAYISFNGMVKSPSSETFLNRTVNLKSARYLDSDTIKFYVSSIEKSPSDNTPDRLFSLLLNEYNFSGKSLTLDVSEADKSTWILGNSSSFIMTCVQY